MGVRRPGTGELPAWRRQVVVRGPVDAKVLQGLGSEALLGLSRRLVRLLVKRLCQHLEYFRAVLVILE